jgi:hypothetical protein
MVVFRPQRFSGPLSVSHQKGVEVLCMYVEVGRARFFRAWVGLGLHTLGSGLKNVVVKLGLGRAWAWGLMKYKISSPTFGLGIRHDPPLVMCPRYVSM